MLLKTFWYQQWDKVVDFNMAEADIKWFSNAKVITKKTA
jgi:acetyl-CoA synthetase